MSIITLNKCYSAAITEDTLKKSKYYDLSKLYINNCLICDTTKENIIIDLINNSEKEVILTGCINKSITNRLKNNPKVIQILPYQDVYGLVAKVYHDDFQCDAIIVRPQEGCTGTCTYCNITDKKNLSHPVDTLVDAISNTMDDTVKAISIVGAHEISNYNHEGKDLIDLINIIYDKFNLPMSAICIQPKYFIKEHIRFQELIKSKKLLFLRISAQSGSHKVLRDMNRDFEFEKLNDIIKEIKSHTTSVKLATEMIYGFPTESFDDIKMSIALANLFDITAWHSYKQLIGSVMSVVSPDVDREKGESYRPIIEQYGKQLGINVIMLAYNNTYNSYITEQGKQLGLNVTIRTENKKIDINKLNNKYWFFTK